MMFQGKKWPGKWICGSKPEMQHYGLVGLKCDISRGGNTPLAIIVYDRTGGHVMAPFVLWQSKNYIFLTEEIYYPIQIFCAVAFSSGKES